MTADKREDTDTTTHGETPATGQEWNQPKLRILDAGETVSGFNNDTDYDFS